jgi:hypothetical protein
MRCARGARAPAVAPHLTATPPPLPPPRSSVVCGSVACTTTSLATSIGPQPAPCSDSGRDTLMVATPASRSAPASCKGVATVTSAAPAAARAAARAASRRQSLARAMRPMPSPSSR